MSGVRAWRRARGRAQAWTYSRQRLRCPSPPDSPPTPRAHVHPMRACGASSGLRSADEVAKGILAQHHFPIDAHLSRRRVAAHLRRGGELANQQLGCLPEPADPAALILAMLARSAPLSNLILAMLLRT